MLDPDQLTEIRDLLAKATPGRWKLWGMTVMADQDGTSNYDTAVEVAQTFYRDEHGKPRTWDASLICELVNAAPDLIAAAETVQRVQALADEWHWTGHIDAESPLGAALRAALATPTDHHNFEEAER